MKWVQRFILLALIGVAAASTLAASGSADPPSLTWNASTDDVGVEAYDVHRSATPGFTPVPATRVGVTASTSFDDLNPAPGTTYYKVVARDAQGNMSPPSNELSYTAPPPFQSRLRAAYAFNEGIGVVTADFAGDGFTGTLAGPTWTSGKYGSALLFAATDDGNDDNDPKVVIGRNVNIPDLPFTISAWVDPVSYTDWRAILSKRDTGSAADMRFDMGLTAGSGSFYVYTGATSLPFSYSPPLNAWTHLALVAEVGSTRLYVGGNLQESQGPITLGADTQANTVIGGTGEATGGDNDPFSGRIDDLRIYDRALSQGEIELDMNTPGGTIVVGVESPVPARVALRVYPNPFSGRTTIHSLDAKDVAVYSVSGRLIRRWSSAMNRPVHWNGTGDKGQPMPSGVYLVKAGSHTARVALLR